jgi:hypothetical protein
MFSACSENCARLGKLGSTGRSHATHPTGLVPADGTKGTPRSATPVRARLRIYARWSLRSGGRGSWKLRLIEGELRTDEALRLQARPGLRLCGRSCGAAGAINFGLSDGCYQATVDRQGWPFLHSWRTLMVT